MLRLLQRMDDSSERAPMAGKPVTPRQRVTSVTLLADADETDLKALQDWAHGLNWVQWLLSGVRQRMVCLHFVTESNTPHTLRKDWIHFAETSLRACLAPHFMEALSAIQKNDLKKLISLDKALSGSLTDSESKRSKKAGYLLLKATRQARYQGILGQYRTACSDGEAHGHFLSVWAAVSDFFQLSLTNSLAEYLRLEWAIATRHQPTQPELVTLSLLTAQLIDSNVSHLRVLA